MKKQLYLHAFSLPKTGWHAICSSAIVVSILGIYCTATSRADESDRFKFGTEEQQAAMAGLFAAGCELGPAYSEADDDFYLVSVIVKKAMAPEDFQLLALFKGLHGVDVDTNSATDADLAFLDQLTELTVLSICSKQVTGAVLRRLANCKKLRSLTLERCPIGDDGWVHIAHLEKIETVRAAKAQITDRAMLQIGRLRGLTTLVLDDNAITDAGVLEIAGLSALRFLSLSGTNMTAECAATIGKLPRLKSLSLSRTKITDAAMVQIAKIITLEHLCISSTPITDEGLIELSPLKNLRDVLACQTYVTQKGRLEMFSRLRSIQTISISKERYEEERAD